MIHSVSLWISWSAPLIITASPAHSQLFLLHHCPSTLLQKSRRNAYWQFQWGVTFNRYFHDSQWMIMHYFLEVHNITLLTSLSGGGGQVCKIFAWLANLVHLSGHLCTRQGDKVGLRPLCQKQYSVTHTQNINKLEIPSLHTAKNPSYTQLKISPTHCLKSRVGNSFICSFAQNTQDERENVSDSLRSLRTNERP